MTFNLLNRKVHYWASMVIAAPILVIACTGILLQLKKHVSWIQPAEQRGSAQPPRITMEQILNVCRGVPEAAIQSWNDINRVDLRPSRGMLKVTAQNNWEIQIDAHLGTVLQVGYRRSDIIESIHDGTWFFGGGKLWVFLPAGAGLLLLWLTGMVLFWRPIVLKRMRRA